MGLHNPTWQKIGFGSSNHWFLHVFAIKVGILPGRYQWLWLKLGSWMM